MTSTLIKTDVQKLLPGTIVDLYQLDTTLTIPGSSILYFHSGTNELGSNVVWQGQTYIKFPIIVDGFERNTSGTLARPKIKISNVLGIISNLIYKHDDIIGSKVTRKRTFVKYLDAVNFTGGTNPTADPTCGFNDEIWFIDRKSVENNLMVEFELSSAFDVAGVKLPRRACIQNVCPWTYRGPECGYTGVIYFKANDGPTQVASKDVCGKRLSSCKLRFPGNSSVPYGGFPGVGKLK